MESLSSFALSTMFRKGGRKDDGEWPRESLPPSPPLKEWDSKKSIINPDLLPEANIDNVNVLLSLDKVSKVKNGLAPLDLVGKFLAARH